jgi:hypothetical protein
MITAEELAEEYCKERNYILPNDGKWSLEALTAFDAFVKGYAKGYLQGEKDDADLATIAHLCGADQMKEIMLNKAVEVEVFDDWQYGKDPDHTVQPAIKLRSQDLKVGEKVKVLIIRK